MSDRNESIKRAFDAQLLAERDAGYVIVRAPLPDDGSGGCHSCKNTEVVDFTPLFERDASTLESYMHVALVCQKCKDDPEAMKKLGDRVVAHGQELRRRFGEGVVVGTREVPSA